MYLEDRVALLKSLKAQYKGKNPTITTMEKVGKKYNLNVREIKFIFFDDLFIKEVVCLGLN